MNSSMVSPEAFMKEYIKELLDGKPLANIMNSYGLQKYEILKELRNELWELKHFKNYEPKNQLTAMFYQECSMLTITEEPVALFSDTHFGSKDEKESIIRYLYNKRKSLLQDVGIEISIDEMFALYNLC